MDRKASADHTLSQFEHLAHTAFAPTVLIVSSRAASDVLSKSHTTLLELLLPFTRFRPSSHKVRGIREEPYELREFRINLIVPEHLQRDEALYPLAQKELADVVQRCKCFPRYEGSSAASPARVEELRNANRGKDMTPWFTRYQTSIVSTTGISEHEFFQHPCACVFVVDSSSPDPTADIVRMHDELLRTAGMWEHGFMDHQFARYHVLLFDAHLSREELKVEAKMNKIRTTFGPQACQFLTLNSIPLQAPVIADNGLASFISDEDVSRCRGLANDIAFKLTIPHLERVARARNEELSASRKTLKSQFGRLFKATFGGSYGYSKARTAPGDTSNCKYNIGSSTAAQSRQLGDVLFMLRDYEGAHYNYKLCTTDFKTDRNLQHYGAALEMCAVCSYLQARQSGSQSAWKDAEADMNRACEQYLKVGEIRFAARATCLLALMCRSRRGFSDMSAVFVRLAENRACDALLSALLHEQSAICFLFTAPAMHRKFSMRLSLAASRFQDAEQTEHSLSCYQVIDKTYKGKGWHTIDERISFCMAMQQYKLGDVEGAMSSAARMFHCDIPAPLTAQYTYLRQFLHIVQSATERGEVLPEVPFPLIADGRQNPRDSVRTVTLSEYGDVEPFVPSSDGRSELEKGAWREMEHAIVYEALVDDAYAHSRRVHIPTLEPARDAFKLDTTVVHEPLSVLLTIENPLSIPLQLSQVQLLCDFYDVREDLPRALLEGDQAGDGRRKKKTPPPVQLTPVDILLPSKQSQRVQLRVVPTQVGVLEVRGIAFVLGRTTWVSRRFEVRRRRVRRKTQQPTEEVDTSLSLQVLPSMPLLSVTIPPLPEQLQHGEVVRTTATLVNNGGLPLANATVRLSHPAFVVFGTPGETREKCEAGSAGGEKKCRGVEAVGAAVPCEGGVRCERGQRPALALSTMQETGRTVADTATAHLNIGPLMPGHSLALPVWVRAAVPGAHTLRLLFYYEPVYDGSEWEACAASLTQYRVHRMTLQTRVLPTLSVCHFTRPSSAHLSAYLLGVTVENRQSALDVNLIQISSISDMWALEPIAAEGDSSDANGHNNPALACIGAREATTLFFRIVPVSPPKDTSLPEDELTFCDLAIGGKDAVRPWRGSAFAALTYRDRLSEPRRVPYGTYDHYLEHIPPISSPPCTLDVALLWVLGGSGNIIGMSAMHGIHLVGERAAAPLASLPSSPAVYSETPKAKEEAEEEEKFASADALRFRVHLPPLVEHDFAASPYCVVPVSIDLCNTSLSNKLHLQVDAVKLDDSVGRSEAFQRSEWQYTWSGITSRSIPSLLPQETKTLQLDACFVQPGVYDVNRFSIAVRSGEETDVVSCDSQQLVRVVPCA